MSTSDVQIIDCGSPAGDNNLRMALFKFTPNVTGASEIVDSHQGRVERKYARREANTYVPRDVQIPPFGLHLLFLSEAPRDDSESATISLCSPKRKFLDEDFRCFTKIRAANGFESKDNETSHKVCEVAIAVTRMCIRRGKVGLE